MIWFSKTIQYRIWPPRPSLEYLLNYKTFSGFPSLDKTAADLTGPVSQQLVPDSFFLLGAMLTNYHIFQGSSISKSSTFGGIRQNHFWKEIFISTERKNGYNFSQVGYFKWRRFLSSTIYFFMVIWTQTACFVTSFMPWFSHRSLEFPVVPSFTICDELGTASTDFFIIWHFSLFTVMMELQFQEGV